MFLLRLDTLSVRFPHSSSPLTDITSSSHVSQGNSYLQVTALELSQRFETLGTEILSPPLLSLPPWCEWCSAHTTRIQGIYTVTSPASIVFHFLNRLWESLSLTRTQLLYYCRSELDCIESPL